MRAQVAVVSTLGLVICAFYAGASYAMVRDGAGARWVALGAASTWGVVLALGGFGWAVTG